MFATFHRPRLVILPFFQAPLFSVPPSASGFQEFLQPQPLHLRQLNQKNSRSTLLIQKTIVEIKLSPLGDGVYHDKLTKSERPKGLVLTCLVLVARNLELSY